ncbi:hypothetical protein BI49514_03048 [Brevibacterium iodinum ATCC 49514]|uniref:Uncharacterized protein n=1 Tax=Brevibacterium iodinum ATCC 49514 TaxID=1255616 RepID=A0A2H1KH97_9MICO|nr:hypothetical protein [Brevibacterium iodinum]SMX99096.1 hypothetical protein BI49514_03048 [Brevibacterium iodinum ATCC 49514]
MDIGFIVALVIGGFILVCVLGIALRLATFACAALAFYSFLHIFLVESSGPLWIAAIGGTLGFFILGAHSTSRLDR